MSPIQLRNSIYKILNRADLVEFKELIANIPFGETLTNEIKKQLFQLAAEGFVEFDYSWNVKLIKK